jgi:response regulator RpfG family c-di-GMP phosphodiesterase
MNTILVVDDDVEVARALRRLLRGEFKVELAHSGAEALQRLEQQPVELVLSDYRMPNMTGAQLLCEVKKRWPATARVILSGYADIESMLSSVNEGEVCRFLRKPWDDGELLATLRGLLEGHDTLASLFQLFKTAPEGASVETMQQDGVARVSVRMAGASGDQTLALAVLKKFVGAFKESDVNLVGGMLERNAGRLSLTMQVGGEQRLIVEVPLGVGDGGSAEAGR